jgi:hypothetical protein
MEVGIEHRQPLRDDLNGLPEAGFDICDERRDRHQAGSALQKWSALSRLAEVTTRAPKVA